MNNLTEAERVIPKTDDRDENIYDEPSDGADLSSEGKCDPTSGAEIPVESVTFVATPAELRLIHKKGTRYFKHIIGFLLTVALTVIIDSVWESTGGIIGAIPYFAALCGLYALFLWAISYNVRNQVKRAEGLTDTLEIYSDHLKYYVYKDGVLHRFFRVCPQDVVNVRYDGKIFSFIADGIIYSIPVRHISENSRLFELIRNPAVKGSLPRDARECREPGEVMLTLMWLCLDLSLVGIVLRVFLSAFSVWIPIVMTILPLLLLTLVLLNRKRSRSVSAVFLGVAVLLCAVYLVTDLIILVDYFIGLIG